jgi:hypothetical protein
MIHTALAQAITSLPVISGAPAPRSPAALVAYVFIFAFAITGLAVMIAFLIGAFRYFFATGRPGAVADAKDRMIHAFLGLLVLLCSVIILYSINPSLLQLRNPVLPGVVMQTAVKIAGVCGVSSAQWTGGTSAKPGSQVGLAAITEYCANSSGIKFTIFNSLGARITEIASTIQNNSASVLWNIPQDALGSRYYFEASVGTSKEVSEYLTIQEQGSLLKYECAANTAKGDPLPASCGAPCENTVNTHTMNPATNTYYPYECKDLILTAASQFQVSPALIVAVMKKECPSGSPNCTSPKGACGLMQVMPSTIFSSDDCRPLMGSNATQDQACQIMSANPQIAVNIGACLLGVSSISAASYKSNYNYASNEIQYAAAAFNGGTGVNAPSCNCRNSGDRTPPGCEGVKVCKECNSFIPKWLCPFDSIGDLCPANTGYDETRNYAATVDAFFTYYSACPQWQ